MKTIHFLALLVLIVLAGCSDADPTYSFFRAVAVGLAVVAVVLFCIGGKRGML